MIARRTGFLLGLTLLLFLSASAEGPSSKSLPRAIVGRLQTPDAARVVVRREPCRCEPLGDEPDILLLTVGTESSSQGDTEFHPLISLAFDRSLRDDETGEWLALWVFGPSPAGWRRTLRSILPIPAGAPHTSARKLERLEMRLDKLRAGEQDAALLVPDTYLDLPELGRFPPTSGFPGFLRRGLAWADVFNPAQFIYRTYLVRRGDRGDRNSQRAYRSLHWLVDVEFTGQPDAAWMETLNDIRFHLLRRRSFFARWIPSELSNEVVHNYDSTMRERLGKSSSWIQSAANENYLRYEPIYRFAGNGAALPLGGVLYYDPRLPAGDLSWWGVGNPFDLPYNPHTHPDVQRLAQENPDRLIPLAVYTFETELFMRPIVVIDFFSPGNPRRRARNQQLMVLLRNWLSITTGSLSLERLPYRAVAWAANKKGFTLLTDKTSRRGIEELRLSLESDLYFDPAWRHWLLERADQRVLNPLVKSGPAERVLARIQYESLRTRDNQAICRAVKRTRKKMMDRLEVSSALSAEAQREELARRLVGWHQLLRLRQHAFHFSNDFEALEAVRGPLEFFLRSDPPYPKKLPSVLRKLYAALLQEGLYLVPDDKRSQLEGIRALTQEVWERAARFEGETGLEKQLAELEQAAVARHGKEERKAQRSQLRGLRQLLHTSRRELWRMAKKGCHPDKVSPADLESELTLLAETIRLASQTEPFRSEVALQRPGLALAITRAQEALHQCPTIEPDLLQADFYSGSRQLVRALLQDLSRRKAPAPAGDD